MRLETLVAADHQWPPPQFMATSLSPPPLADNSQAMAQHFAARRALFAQHQQQVGFKIHSGEKFIFSSHWIRFLIRTLFHCMLRLGRPHLGLFIISIDENWQIASTFMCFAQVTYI
jgi:hypothetical protein